MTFILNYVSIFYWKKRSNEIENIYTLKKKMREQFEQKNVQEELNKSRARVEDLEEQLRMKDRMEK